MAVLGGGAMTPGAAEIPGSRDGGIWRWLQLPDSWSSCSPGQLRREASESYSCGSWHSPPRSAGQRDRLQPCCLADMPPHRPDCCLSLSSPAWLPPQHVQHQSSNWVKQCSAAQPRGGPPTDSAAQWRRWSSWQARERAAVPAASSKALKGHHTLPVHSAGDVCTLHWLQEAQEGAPGRRLCQADQ